jgi:hypothetical protein
MEKNRGQLKFYADTPIGDSNKLFVWKVDDYPTALEALKKFILDKGFFIRAAWYIYPDQAEIQIKKELWTEKVILRNQDNLTICKASKINLNP